MMKYLLLFSITLLSVVTIAQTNDLDVSKAPSFAPLNQHNTLEKPTSYQRVALLNIKLKYENGEIVGAELVHSKVVASVAPKVFARQMGEWQVYIGKNEKNVFYVNDPGYLEAENEPGDKVPYHYVSQGAEVQWDLVVPLYRNGREIDASTILIKRVSDGKPILQSRI